MSCTYHRKLFVALVVEAEDDFACLFSWTYGSSHFPSSSSAYLHMAQPQECKYLTENILTEFRDARQK